MIHLKLCTILNFDHTTKCYKHKSKSILENKRYEVIWDFDIQMDHLMRAKRSELELILTEKITCGYSRPGRPQNENKRKQKNRQILVSCLRCKKTKQKTLWHIRATVKTIVDGAIGKVPKGWKKQNQKKTQKELEIRGRIKSPRPQHYWDWLEYRERYNRLEKTCCHSDSIESPPYCTGGKNSQGGK